MRDFYLSGFSGVGAICCTNPVDVVKTRLQLQGELSASPGAAAPYRGVLHGMFKIWQTEGMRGLQRGLVPACLLQFSSLSVRFGFYETAKKFYQITPDTPHRFAKSVALAGCSGAISAVISNPFFLLKTRMQSASVDASMSVGKTAWNPRMGMVASANCLYNAEGLVGFSRGMPALMLRIGAASAAQLATYDAAKTAVMTKVGPIAHRLGGPELHERALSTHFAAALVTSFATVLAMQPFDFAATRMSNDGRGTYSSSFAVLRDTARGPEGIMGISKGSWANYMRFGPYCILVFIFREQLMMLTED